jgi:hypothetical protein
MKFTRKFAKAVIATMVVITTATSASADWNSFWHNLHVGFHRNNAWPDPFNEVDAMQVVTPFEVMKANGWKMHNTIGHELFRPGDGALLASGHNRVHWIATQAPTNRRTVYVLQGGSRVETEARVASVQQTLANMYFNGSAPHVMVTTVEPSTWPGAWRTKINREWLENLPIPRLPSESASGQAGATTPSGG